MAGHLLFAGAPTGRFPAPSILALVSVLADGLFVPEGGMGSLPQVLAESVRARGGTIALGAPVDRIRRKPGGGFSVHAGAAKPLDCQWVISTASPYTTLARLVQEVRLPLSWQRRLARPRLSMKVLSVQLGLRNAVGTLSHLNHHLPSPESMETYFTPKPGAVDWVYASVPSLVAPGLAPAGGGVVELYPAIPQAEPADRVDCRPARAVGRDGHRVAARPRADRGRCPARAVSPGFPGRAWAAWRRHLRCRSVGGLPGALPAAHPHRGTLPGRAIVLPRLRGAHGGDLRNRVPPISSAKSSPDAERRLGIIAA